jgi:hypothetical protein
MKTFLYVAVSVRNGSEDNVFVCGGSEYYRRQLMLVIDAPDHEQAAKFLGLTIVGSFDRSRSGLPTVYYTAVSDDKSHHLYVKEVEKSDCVLFPELEKKTKLKFVVASWFSILCR